MTIDIQKAKRALATLQEEKRAQNVGFSLQLKPNNILIKQSPNAHIPSLAGKSA